MYSLRAQTRIQSFGFSTGVIAPYTWDEGIQQDQRFQNRYDLKWAPIALHYGIDYEGFGFYIDPGLINIGQNFYVVNTVGGQDGLRKANLRYAQVPVVFKLHVLDLSFFKLSFCAGGSAAYLLDGKETIRHSDTKLRFPSEVYSKLPAEYSVVYDGVVSPSVNYTLAGKDDFKPYQFFGIAGFRSDFDATEEWRVSFDFMVSYGLVDPRSNVYKSRVDNYEALYDLPGNRRDLFLQIGIGISRYMELDRHDREHGKQTKGTPKRKTSNYKSGRRNPRR
jgi:hypothetical protein